MSSMDATAGDTTADRRRKIINALETYFSDASLLWDKVMQQKILTNPGGMVPLSQLVQLPKLRSFQLTEEDLLKYIEEHSLTRLQLNEDKTKLGRIRPYVPNKKDVLDEWSIYVEGLTKPYHEEFAIKELFHTLVGGHVSFFAIPPNQQGSKAFFGYCFLEFDDKANVAKAIQLFSRSKRSSAEHQAENNTDEVILDEKQAKLLKKLDLRVMSKLEWNRLRDEYVELLAEKKAGIQKLWDDYNKENLPEETKAEEKQDDDEDTRMEETHAASQKRRLDAENSTAATKKYKSGAQHSGGSSTMATGTDDYPKGIIVFVDNLHPQCSKTIALKMLETNLDIKIPFMTSKKKGLACAHIRLNTPEDARKICEYFNEQHAIVQEHEKDISGKEMNERTRDCVKMRLLQGTEERIYWENDKRR